MSSRTLAEGVYRDREGRIRLIETDPSYARMVNRAFDKVRQSSRGMPAVIIRLIDALSTIENETSWASQRRVLLRQAEAILRAAKESVSEPNDCEDIEASISTSDRRRRRPTVIRVSRPRPFWKAAEDDKTFERRMARIDLSVRCYGAVERFRRSRLCRVAKPRRRPSRRVGFNPNLFWGPPLVAINHLQCRQRQSPAEGKGREDDGEVAKDHFDVAHLSEARKRETGGGRVPSRSGWEFDEEWRIPRFNAAPFLRGSRFRTC